MGQGYNEKVFPMPHTSSIRNGALMDTGSIQLVFTCGIEEGLEFCVRSGQGRFPVIPSGYLSCTRWVSQENALDQTVHKILTPLQPHWVSRDKKK